MRDSKKADVLFLLPALIICTLTLIASFWNYKVPIYSINSAMNLAGVILFIIGLIIRVHAAWTLDKNYSWTLEIRENHSLIKNGLYRYIRHPIYSGVIISAFTVPVFTSSVIGFFIILFSILLLIYRIGVEEKMLIEEYRDEYRDYMKNTWRLVPYLY